MRSQLVLSFHLEISTMVQAETNTNRQRQRKKVKDIRGREGERNKREDITGERS